MAAGTKEHWDGVILSRDNQLAIRKAWFDYMKIHVSLHPEMCPGVWSDTVGCNGTLESCLKLCTWASAVLTYPPNASVLGFETPPKMPDCNFDGCKWNKKGKPASEGGASLQAKWQPVQPKPASLKNTQACLDTLKGDRLLVPLLTNEELGHLLWALQPASDKPLPDRQGLLVPAFLDAPGALALSDRPGAPPWKTKVADKSHFVWHQQVMDHLLDDLQSPGLWTVDKYWKALIESSVRVAGLLKQSKQSKKRMKVDVQEQSSGGDCIVVEDTDDGSACFCALVPCRTRTDTGYEWTGKSSTCKCPW